MASAQVSVKISAEEYYEKNKSIVDELIATAKCLSTNIINQDTTRTGVIKNKTQDYLLLGPSHDGAGNPCVGFPPSIGPGESARFVLGSSNMRAVIYTSGKTNLGWLLAWSVGGSTGHGNKVYVEVGPLDHLTNWANVKAKLYKSGSAQCFWDSASHRMFATITPVGDKVELVAIYEQC